MGVKGWRVTADRQSKPLFYPAFSLGPKSRIISLQWPIARQRRVAESEVVTKWESPLSIVLSIVRRFWPGSARRLWDELSRALRASTAREEDNVIALTQ